MLLLPNLPFTQTVRKGFQELGGEITIGKIICENSLSLGAQRKKGEKTNRRARYEESLPQILNSIRSQL